MVGAMQCGEGSSELAPSQFSAAHIELLYCHLGAWQSIALLPAPFCCKLTAQLCGRVAWPLFPLFQLLSLRGLAAYMQTLYSVNWFAKQA